MFDKFLQATITTSACLNIVDIKYLDSDYFKNGENYRDAKERSIRKQFLYEYLLQQYIQKNNKLKDLEVKSCFWIPSYCNEDTVFKTKSILGGHIDLSSVNFNKIVDDYLL
jgi:hypothetical protein